MVQFPSWKSLDNNWHQQELSKGRALSAEKLAELEDSMWPFATTANGQNQMVENGSDCQPGSSTSGALIVTSTVTLTMALASL